MNPSTRPPQSPPAPMSPDSQPSSSSPGMHEASRREKLRKIQELGFDPWGSRFDDHSSIGAIRARENEITVEPIPEGPEQREPTQRGPKVRAAGRIVLQRKKG